MTKLHSFTNLIFFLICGQLACAGTDSGTDRTGIAGEDASTVSKPDDAKASEKGANSPDAEPATGDDNGSLRADAGAADAAKPDAGQHDMPAAEVAEPAATALPGTFSHIYDQAFKACRANCHVMGYSMLNMATRDAAYAALVDQDSNPRNMNCAPLGLKRVKPGFPEESLLYLKLDPLPPCGQQMPPGGLIRQEFRDEVRDWILNGAKDD